MSKSKKPKDPNAPKKNQSSYFIFSNERRSILQSENTDKPITEISKIISSEWKAMDQSTKKSYELKAAEDKKRYQEEFEVYSKTESYKKHQQKLKEWKENEKAMGRGKGKGKKGKGPKKPKQPDSMPKRPQSSYFIFSNERRNEMKELYPEKKITELSKLIAEEWKIKTSEEKKIYEEKASSNKEKYQKDIDEYKKTDEYKQYQQDLDDWKQEKKRWEKSMDVDSDEEGLKKISMPRKPKDDKCPKRPLTSYFLYAKEVREATKAEFPNKAITDIAKEISKKWKSLTEDEKKPYNSEAARLKEQYKKDLAEYEGSDAQKAYKQKLEEWKLECNRRKQEAKKKLNKKREKELEKKKKSQQKNKKIKKTKGRKKRMEVESDSSDDSGSDSDSSSGSTSDSDSESSSGSSSDSDSESSSDDSSSDSD